jgi:hypothetical protein
MKKRKIRIVLIILLAIVATAMIIAPLIARVYVSKNGKELIGREINIEKIRVNYFTFTFRVIGFKLFEKDDTTLFAGFDTLLVDLQPIKLLGSELVLKRLWLISPEAEITKRDTVFNFSDIVEFFATSDTTAVKDTIVKDSDFKFELSDIRLKEGSISFTDELINHTTLLNNLTFNIPYLSWNQEESSKAGLKFNFRNGGYFAADGSFDPKNGDFNSIINISDLDLNQFAAYIKPYINFNSIEGLAGCDLNISGNSEKLDSLMFKGRFSVNSFVATDNTDRKILGTDNLNVSFNPSLPLAGRFNIDTVSLTKPYLLFEMHDSSNNFIELFPPEQPDTATSDQVDADSLSIPVTYSVNSFTINDGTVDFADITLEDPFKYNFSQIKLKVDSVNSNSSWVTAYSTMILNGQGDLKAEIGINPSDPYELKVDYIISNFQLPDFSPYSKFYLGSAIVYGNMYYAGKTSITARQISSENKLVIRNAEIGKKSGGIFNIPLRLALYLIKDLNGDIKIDMPITGDLNDPQIKIGKLIWTTFKNLIVKIAASPFIALSGVFGIDDKELQQIDFNYADTLLSDTNRKKLDQLLLIKEKKPELIIELAYFNDRELEKKQIGLEVAGSLFNKQTGENYIIQKDKFEEFLKTSLLKDTIDLYNDCLILAGVDKTDSISKYRDNLRITLIDNYLKTIDTLSRIKIFIPNPDAIKNVGSHPVFEIKFSMEE